MSDLTDSQRILEALTKARTQLERLKKPADQRIAIVGMAGRFPGAESVDEFWELLREGKSGIRDLTEDELEGLDLDLEEDYVKRYASFAEPTAFDADFFGYAPREAELLDPQHRVFLECAWTALEDAGYDAHQTNDRIGVYAGSALNTYLVNLSNDPEIRESVNEVQAVVSNVMGLMPTRVSYHLDLRGPSCGIQTGCSTSLVALHEACRAVLDGDCEMALAGGVTIGRPEPEGYLYEPGGIASPDGCCRPFDAEGKGTLFGNGVGVVVLKKFEDAVRDGDAIRAVILGTAINNDGADKVGLLAPSVAGQTEVIRQALKRADVSPATISYVEGHGTATELGDPVEFAALDQAMGDPLLKKGVTCRLGSVKSNVGHLDAAAGVAGVIKTVLALQHESLPPTLHFEKANPQIDLAERPFEVSRDLSPWPRNELPRRAGVSSFGMGGTNAHAILEEAPLRKDASSFATKWVFALSAKSEQALARKRGDLEAFLKSGTATLADVAFTLQVGRRAMAYRQAVVGGSSEELFEKLSESRSCEVKDARPVVFLFSGQGSQYPEMGRELYENEPVFRDALDECAAEIGDLELIALVTQQDQSLQETAVVQPALFALEYALARLVMSWEVKPAAMLGHSLGEYVAACLAGVFSLKDALRLVRQRGALMQRCPEGSMLAVRAGVVTVQEWLDEGLEIAAANAPDQTVVSGSRDDILKLQEELTKNEIASMVLPTSHAFHSGSMEPALAGFREALQGIDLDPPKLDLISNRTGKWLTAAEATDVEYWVDHLRHSVLFHEGLRTLSANLPEACYLELGPGQTLCRFTEASLKGALAIPVLPEILEAQAKLWRHGVRLNWVATHAEKPRRVPMPTYPFERRKHFISRKYGAEKRKQVSSVSWFSIPAWRQSPLLSGAKRKRERLVMIGRPDCKTALKQFEPVWVDEGEVRPSSKEDFLRLIETLGDGPIRWIYLWNLEDGISRLIALAQAFQEFPSEETRSLDVVTQGSFEASGPPQQAALSGLLKVFPQEIARLECRLLDGQSLDHLVREWTDPSDEKVIAHLGRNRWVQEYQEVALPDLETPNLIKGGTYLVIGDLVDGLGLVYARALRDELNAKLILIGREDIPGPSAWDSWLASHGGQHPLSQTVKRIKALGREGEDFVMDSVALADETAVQEAVQARLGDERLAGIFYADVMGGEASCALSELTEDEQDRIFEKKVRQVDAVMALVEAQNPGFVVLQSTLSAIIGGPGFAAYAAAGSYLDGIALRSEHPALVAINWDACRLDDWESQGDSRLMAGAFSREEVWQATRKILAQPHLRQVIVSRRSLEEEPALPAEVIRDEAGKYEAPRTSVEAAVAKAMGDLLGIPKIGRHDDFFAQGGHSLLAIQAVTKLRKEFKVEVPMRAILQGTPTVAGIAQVIEESMSSIDEDQASLVEDLLEQIEGEEK